MAREGPEPGSAQRPAQPPARPLGPTMPHQGGAPDAAGRPPFQPPPRVDLRGPGARPAGRDPRKTAAGAGISPSLAQNTQKRREAGGGRGPRHGGAQAPKGTGSSSRSCLPLFAPQSPLRKAPAPLSGASSRAPAPVRPASEARPPVPPRWAPPAPPVPAVPPGSPTPAPPAGGRERGDVPRRLPWDVEFRKKSPELPEKPSPSGLCKRLRCAAAPERTWPGQSLHLAVARSRCPQPRHTGPLGRTNSQPGLSSSALEAPAGSTPAPRPQCPSTGPGGVGSGPLGPGRGAAPFPVRVRVGPRRQGPGTTLPPRDPDGWRREGKPRAAAPPSRCRPPPTRLCPAGPRRKPGALTRRGAQGGQGRQENPERIRRAGAPQARGLSWCPAEPPAGKGRRPPAEGAGEEKASRTRFGPAGLGERNLARGPEQGPKPPGPAGDALLSTPCAAAVPARGPKAGGEWTLLRLRPGVPQTRGYGSVLRLPCERDPPTHTRALARPPHSAPPAPGRPPAALGRI
ncbi:basic proline-rich protein-like [Meles meles]|uniref:basic proline-rich protein-like n=1 Tax=Meles meles TaxID=9662 RepID=UPI001E69CC76|nr:basic proline-rich protein-like [Meles meles]